MGREVTRVCPGIDVGHEGVSRLVSDARRVGSRRYSSLCHRVVNFSLVRYTSEFSFHQ